MKDTILPSLPAFFCLALALLLTYGSEHFDRLAMTLNLLASCFVIVAVVTIRIRRQIRELQQQLSELKQRSNVSGPTIG